MENQLPSILEFTGSEVTEGDFKVALNKLLLYLKEAIGADGGNLFPSGFIGMWSGAMNKIPAGWALCNGENGTPDLRDKFIVGAGGNYVVGATGGDTSQTVQMSGQTGETTLTVNQMPSHSHAMFTTGYGSGIKLYSGENISGPYPVINPIYTASSGGGLSHSHGLSGTSTVSTLPPYYALCFIMKV